MRPAGLLSSGFRLYDFGGGLRFGLPIHNLVGRPRKLTITLTTAPAAGIPGTYNLYWSAMASARPPGNIWVTRPRTSFEQQSTPWPCKKLKPSRAPAASQMIPIGDGTPPTSRRRRPKRMSPPNGIPMWWNQKQQCRRFFPTPQCSDERQWITSAAIFGRFPAGISLEQKHPGRFTTGGPAGARGFFITPVGVNGLPAKYLGYLRLSTNGALTYTAGRRQ